MANKSLVKLLRHSERAKAKLEKQIERKINSLAAVNKGIQNIKTELAKGIPQ
jgi:hypothetical protein